MFKVRNPASIAPPVGAYSHSVEIPAGARILSIAGQAGIRPDGTLPESFEEQHEEVWKNTLAILADAGMGPENLVHLNVYSTEATGIRFLAPHRAKYLPEGYLTTSTWVVVSALANPKWVVEMEAIAAKVD